MGRQRNIPGIQDAIRIDSRYRYQGQVIFDPLFGRRRERCGPVRGLSYCVRIPRAEGVLVYNLKLDSKFQVL